MLSIRDSQKAAPRRGPAASATALALTALALISAAAPPGSLAQEGCVAGDKGRNDAFIRTLPGIGTVTYIGGAYFTCDGGVEIFADSAVAYEQRAMSELIGSVRYVEDGRELRAARARYFTNEGRLQAQGDVIVVDRANGSSIRDGDLVYLLETDFREVSEMTVTVGSDGLRPRAVLTPPPDTARVDSLGTPVAPDDAPAEPYVVDANRIYLRGSGYFSASGDVVIERDSLFAYADSAEHDQAAEGLTLVDDARVIGTGYELTGRTITMSNPGGDASEVRALREARLIGADVLLTAARIVVLLRDGDLDRLVATTITADSDAEPDSLDLQRPEALVEDFVLTADSLSVAAPGERLQRVFAAGRARSVSTAQDSMNTDVLPEIARTDWLEGDTVIIRFVGSPPVPPFRSAQGASTVPGDSASGAPVALGDSAATADSATAATGDSTDQAEVEEIIARVEARSLYRLPPNDSTYQAGTHPPAVHYVVGQEIRIRLESGEVQGMEVTGQTRGIHLEPIRRPTTVDSAGGARVDTMAVPDSGLVPDTTFLPDTAAVDTLHTVHSATPTWRLGVPTHEGNDQKRNGGMIRLEKEHPWKRR